MTLPCNKALANGVGFAHHRSDSRRQHCFNAADRKDFFAAYRYAAAVAVAVADVAAAVEGAAEGVFGRAAAEVGRGPAVVE